MRNRGQPYAIGIVCRCCTRDPDEARTILEKLADRHRLALVEVVTWSSDKAEVWILDLLEAVEKHRARAVGLQHIGGNIGAIIAVADLIMPTLVMKCVGYGKGGQPMSEPAMFWTILIGLGVIAFGVIAVMLINDVREPRDLPINVTHTPHRAAVRMYAPAGIWCGRTMPRRVRSRSSRHVR